MLQQQSLTQLRTLKLSGMADALDLQWQQPQTYGELSFWFDDSAGNHIT